MKKNRYILCLVGAFILISACIKAGIPQGTFIYDGSREESSGNIEKIAISARADNQGDLFGNETALWVLDLYFDNLTIDDNDRFYGKGGYAYFYIIADLSKPDDISGTYELNNSREQGTSYLKAAFYCEKIDEDGDGICESYDASKWSYPRSGKIVITKNSDGTYKVEVDALNDNLNEDLYLKLHYDGVLSM